MYYLALSGHTGGVLLFAIHMQPPGLKPRSFIAQRFRAGLKTRFPDSSPGLHPDQSFSAACKALNRFAETFPRGFENPLPRIQVRGYTRTGVFPQPVKPSIDLPGRFRGFENPLPGRKKAAEKCKLLKGTACLAAASLRP
jgi:hypothetical protein